MALSTLAMTYFLTGTRNIIGAASFHGPVRDGKGWGQRAMVARNSAVACAWSSRDEWGIEGLGTGLCIASCREREARGTSFDAQGYRVKPHGQLVPVSSRHYCPYTPGLSTSWSRTTLQGSQAPGRSHLQASFPLRCFQRLSLPHIATRRCDWRHNRYTRDASTPVLSY